MAYDYDYDMGDKTDFYQIPDQFIYYAHSMWHAIDGKTT